MGKSENSSLPSKQSKNEKPNKNPNKTNNTSSVTNDSPAPHPKNAPTVSKKIKKVHIAKNELSVKMKQVQDQINELQGAEHHKKRKRLFYKLAKLKKASENPEEFLVDASQEQAKKDQDLQRRITKKKQKNSFQATLGVGPQKRHQKACLICKKVGHTMHECPESEFLQNEGVDLNTTLCYNCGRTDHTLKNCRKKRKASLPFAVCYVCKESGHIARECPKNEKGMYAKGGGCYICDSVRHKASECPNNPANQIRERKNNKETKHEKMEKEISEDEGENMEGNYNGEELEPEIEEEAD